MCAGIARCDEGGVVTREADGRRGLLDSGRLVNSRKMDGPVAAGLGW
jgi:hypothetical protein